MEVVVKCSECNTHLEEHKVEKEFQTDMAIYVIRECNCECENCEE